MANMAQAIRMALHYGEKHLGVTDIFGEDVGPPLGGVFTVTQGLKTSWNSPLDERGIMGVALGLALAGQKPVCEIQFCDYIYNTIDLMKLVGNMHWSSAGEYNIPLVCMTPAGAGIHGSIYHSHSFDAMATQIPGWKIVFPSNPLDAYGLMIAAIKDPNPVLYFKGKALLRMKGKDLIPGEPADEKLLRKMIDQPVTGDISNWKPEWPDLQEYVVEIGKGKIVQEGDELTIVTYGRHVHVCEQAIKNSGKSVELIDLRTIYPYDWDLISQSIEKTRKVIFVNEDKEVTNFGEHLFRRTVEDFFDKLHAPPKLIAGKNVPGVGLAPSLEEASVPQVRDIEAGILELCSINY